MLLACPAHACSAVFERVLETPGYQLRISSRCAEGEVVCRNVDYHGISKRSGNALRLQGATHHIACADGVTPCRFVGYVFKNGRYRYLVTEEGRLLVHKGDAVLVDQTGYWH